MELLIKPGVEPASFVVLAAISRMQPAAGWPKQITITAGSDGKHMVGSFHYVGKAVDIRTFDFPSNTAVASFMDALRKELGNKWQVLLEADHVHVEQDGQLHSVNT